MDTPKTHIANIPKLLQKYGDLSEYEPSSTDRISITSSSRNNLSNQTSCLATHLPPQPQLLPPVKVGIQQISKNLTYFQKKLHAIALFKPQSNPISIPVSDQSSTVRSLQQSHRNANTPDESHLSPSSLIVDAVVVNNNNLDCENSQIDASLSFPRDASSITIQQQHILPLSPPSSSKGDHSRIHFIQELPIQIKKQPLQKHVILKKSMQEFQSATQLNSNTIQHEPSALLLIKKALVRIATALILILSFALACSLISLPTSFSNLNFLAFIIYPLSNSIFLLVLFTRQLHVLGVSHFSASFNSIFDKKKNTTIKRPSTISAFKTPWILTFIVTSLESVMLALLIERVLLETMKSANFQLKYIDFTTSFLRIVWLFIPLASNWIITSIYRAFKCKLSIGSINELSISDDTCEKHSELPTTHLGNLYNNFKSEMTKRENVIQYALQAPGDPQQLEIRALPFVEILSVPSSVATLKVTTTTHPPKSILTPEVRSPLSIENFWSSIAPYEIPCFFHSAGRELSLILLVVIIFIVIIPVFTYQKNNTLMIASLCFFYFSGAAAALLIKRENFQRLTLTDDSSYVSCLSFSLYLNIVYQAARFIEDQQNQYIVSILRIATLLILFSFHSFAYINCESSLSSTQPSSINGEETNKGQSKDQKIAQERERQFESRERIRKTAIKLTRLLYSTKQIVLFTISDAIATTSVASAAIILRLIRDEHFKVEKNKDILLVLAYLGMELLALMIVSSAAIGVLQYRLQAVNSMLKGRSSTRGLWMTISTMTQTVAASYPVIITNFLFFSHLVFFIATNLSSGAS